MIYLIFQINCQISSKSDQKFVQRKWEVISTFHPFLREYDQQKIMKIKLHKKNANWISHIASSSILLMQSEKLHVFMKDLLISPILYKWRTLINFGFLTKEDYRYMVPVLNFCNIFICIQNHSSI